MVNCFRQPNKQRPRIGRQVLPDLLGQPAHINLGVADGGHASLALLPTHLNAVHNNLGEVHPRADHILHLHRRHILAPPPERVAHAVTKVNEAVVVRHNHVARVEGRLTGLEQIVDNLFGRVFIDYMFLLYGVFFFLFDLFLDLFESKWLYEYKIR